MDEEIYINVKQEKPFTTRSSASEKETCHHQTEKRTHCCILLLGILCLLLLFSLIVLAAHHHTSVWRSAADLTTITAQLTTERERLNASLMHITQKQNRVNCPSGWRMFQCDCYLVSNESKSWRKAQDDCRSRGARLVVVDSTEEQTFLSGLTEQRSMLWIGLTDKTEEGSWKWLSGDAFTLSFWRAPQPDNGGGFGGLGEEDCAHITTGTHSSSNWNDLSCNASLRWICERGLTMK